MKNSILITGIGGPAGRSTAAYFKEKGYFVMGADMRDVKENADSFHILPPALFPEYPAALLNIIKKERPSLLVPTVTEELYAVSKLKDEIEGQGCAVFISDPESVEIANNKFMTASFFGGRGVPVPLTFNGSASKDLVMKTLSLPILSKPCFGRGGRGVSIYRSPEEVYRDNRSSQIFQEFIPGEEFDGNLFIDKDGEVLACIVLKKTVLKDGIIGNALQVERVEKVDVADLSIKAAKLLDAEGPIDMDIRLRESGEPVILEVNARVGGNVLYAREVLDGLTEAWQRGNAL